MKNRYEDEIDLLELFFTWLRHWKLVALSGILFAGIFFGYSRYMIAPVYSSTSVLYVLSDSTSITSLADIQIGTQLTKDYIEVIRYRSVMEQVIKNLNLDKNEGWTYGKLASRVRVSNPENSRLLKITVSDTDPKRAKILADEVAEVSRAFIAEGMNQEAPNLIQHAYEAIMPDSPNITKNTMMGGMLGIMLVLAIVTLQFLLNDTIMTPEELERKTGMTMLAAIPVTKREYDGRGGKRRIHRKRSKKKTKQVKVKKAK